MIFWGHRHSTRMKLMWDDEALYLGAWMAEPQVVATLTERNSVVFQDNDFEIFLNPGWFFAPKDPDWCPHLKPGPVGSHSCLLSADVRCVRTSPPADGSNHQYYEFEVNALNTVWELRLDKPYMHGGSEHSERVGMRGQGNLPNLESGIRVDGAVNDPGAVSKGWSVTARFPFADLIAQGHCKSPPRWGAPLVRRRAPLNLPPTISPRVAKIRLGLKCAPYVQARGRVEDQLL